MATPSSFQMPNGAQSSFSWQFPIFQRGLQGEVSSFCLVFCLTMIGEDRISGNIRVCSDIMIDITRLDTKLPAAPRPGIYGIPDFWEPFIYSDFSFLPFLPWPLILLQPCFKSFEGKKYVRCNASWFVCWLVRLYKLDGLSLVDNRPSVDQLHHYVLFYAKK